jgi:pimeloyl-ACP methyl ester carboxylesterase
MARLLVEPVTLDTPEGTIQVSYGFLVDGLRGGLTFPPIWAELAGQLEQVWQATEARASGAPTAPSATSRPLTALSTRSTAPAGTHVALNEKRPAPIDGYDNSAEALLAVACSETTGPQNPKAWPKLAADADATAPYFGAEWAYLVQACATWPARDHDRFNGPYTAHTANPVLFVSSRFDAASSYEHTQALVASIPGARLLTLEGAGHPASFVADSCISQAVASYLIGQELPPTDAVCQPELQPFGAVSAH